MFDFGLHMNEHHKRRIGFNYGFDTLDSSGQPNELSEAFLTMSSAIQNITILDLLQAFIPVLRLVVSAIPILVGLISLRILCTFQPSTKSRKLRAAQRTITQIGKELLTNAKAAVLSGATEKGEFEKNALYGRDLLSLLVKANMATDTPESQKLSDKDVIARAFHLACLRLNAQPTEMLCSTEVPTFLVAGHETTR